MKKLIIYATAMLCITACNNNQLVKTSSLTNDVKPVTPAALLTPAGQSWKVSPAKRKDDRSVEKVSYKTKKDTAGKLTKAKFETGEGFTFSYTNKNTEQDAVTTVQGKVVFGTNNYGKNIFTLQPLKGTCLVNNKEIPLGINELKEKFSLTYRWEKINFTGMPAEDFLLLVDLTACPAAASTKAGDIDKACISKFYPR